MSSARREASAAEVTRPTLTGSPPSTARSTPSSTSTPRARSPRPATSTGVAPPARSSTSWHARPSPSRTSWPPRACRPPAARRSSRAGSPYDATLVSGCARPGCRSWARRTWTSSRWAPPPSTRPTADPQPVGPRAHPGRVRRRLLRGRGGVRGAARHRHRHRRLDPPARGRHRHGRHQADLRRRLALRPRGWPPASTRRPCSRTVLDAALLHSGDRRPRPARLDSIHAGAARRRGRPPRRRQGHAHRCGEGARWRGLPARRARAVRRVGEAARRRRRRGRRGLLPELRLRARGLLPDPAERGVVQLAKFDAMRYGLRVLPEGVDDPSAEQVMAATRDAGFGDEVKRRIILGTYALSRLLRRLLRAGPEGAHPDLARLQRRVREGRRPAQPDRADHGVPPGEKLDDPMAMYLNDIATIPANLAGVPGMSPALRPRRGGRPAHRHPDPGPRHRGRPSLPRRRRAREAPRRPVGRTAADAGTRADREGA